MSSVDTSEEMLLLQAICAVPWERFSVQQVDRRKSFGGELWRRGRAVASAAWNSNDRNNLTKDAFTIWKRKLLLAPRKAARLALISLRSTHPVSLLPEGEALPHPAGNYDRKRRASGCQ
jgi:hypothetical protein